MKKPGINPAHVSKETCLEADPAARLIVSTINTFQLSFDEAKSSRNARERGLPFAMVRRFDFGTAIYQLDSRNDYPEPRYVALGWLDDRLHVLCFTPHGQGIRVISFRKANQRELRFYEKACTID